MNFKPIIDRIEYGGCMIGQEEKDAINRVIDNQGGRRWTIGPESVAFEEELAQVTGVKKSVVVNSGSSALLVATAALKLPKGSKVIIPALNFPTAYSSLLQNNLVPVVIDCDLSNLNLSLKEVERAIDENPDIEGVVAVHIAGNVVDMKELRRIVGNRKIISDNCDGYGGTIDGKFVDTYADVSCVSFHAAHIISMGEGGAVLTDDEEVAIRARKIREWGRASGTDTITKHEGFPEDYKERYVFEEIGYNMKPLELQCAMGRIQLKKLQGFKEKRKDNYNKLNKIFSSKSVFKVIGSTTKDADNCWFSFPFLCEGVERKKVTDHFEKMNIETRTIFSGNILKHPAYKKQPHIQIGDLSNSNYVMKSGVFITAHPQTTQEMIDFIETVVDPI